jgi:hypothetical protein
MHASYRNTHTVKNVLSLREVKRDITQHVDGTIQTFETETIKERSVVQQEEIERQFVIAKEIYVNKQIDAWYAQVKKWKSPSVSCVRRLNRRFQTLKNADFSFCQTTKSFVEFLQEEHRALSSNLWFLSVNTQLFQKAEDQKEFTVEVQKHHKNFDRNNENLSSQYFERTLEQLRKNMQINLELEQMVTNLAKDEQAQHHPVHVKEVSKGVLQRISTPIFPFSEEEMQVADTHEAQRRHVDMDFYKNYLFCALKSNGQDPKLVIPAFRQLLTTKLMNKEKTQLPRLVDITQITKKSRHCLPFTSSIFWGKCTSEKTIFANCHFEINNIEYANVWLEMSLLCQNIEYQMIVESKSYNLVLAAEQEKVDQISDVEEMIRLNPRCSSLKKLRHMKCNLEDMLETKKETALLIKQKRELDASLSNFKTKTRRMF